MYRLTRFLVTYDDSKLPSTNREFCRELSWAKKKERKSQQNAYVSFDIVLLEYVFFLVAGISFPIVSGMLLPPDIS